MVVCLELVDCAQDGSLRVALERVLQDSGELGVSEVHVGVPRAHLPSLAQPVDHVTESQETLVDVRAFSVHHALAVHLADALRPSEVHEVDNRALDALP